MIGLSGQKDSLQLHISTLLVARSSSPIPPKQLILGPQALIGRNAINVAHCKRLKRDLASRVHHDIIISDLESAGGILRSRIRRIQITPRSG